jgi:hypothetical protein
MLHQTSYFSGHVQDVLKILIECRSHASNTVSATANDTLTTAMDLLDPQSIVSALSNLCLQWSQDDSNKVSLSNARQYRPLPLTSGLYFLGEVLGNASPLNYSPSLLVDLSVKCLNESQPEIRKAAVDSLVGLNRSMGDDMWDLLEDKLTEMQRKLLLIYIERDKMQSSVQNPRVLKTRTRNP